MGYYYDTTKDSGNYTPASQSLAVFKYNRTIEGITIHWWGDPNLNPSYAGIVNYMIRAGGNTSAHFVATGTGRQVACVISPLDVAWATGSAYGNAKTISIECDPRMREEDYDVVAELIADIRSAYGDVPIYSHNMWSATTCPGGYDITRLDNMSYQKQSNAEWGQVTNKTTVAQPTPPSVPAPTAPVETLLYKVNKGGKQIGAFAKDINAWSWYTENQADSITISGKDVTALLKTKFTAPSPTTQNPDGTTQADSGKAVAEKLDYLEKELAAQKTLIDIIVNFLLATFKNFKK